MPPFLFFLPAARDLFRLAPMTPLAWGVAIAAAVLSTAWGEPLKRTQQLD